MAVLRRTQDSRTNSCVIGYHTARMSTEEKKIDRENIAVCMLFDNRCVEIVGSMFDHV